MKPDWATRLQNTFKKRYNLGWVDGYLEGYTRASNYNKENLDWDYPELRINEDLHESIRKHERERIVAVIKKKRDNFTKPVGYNPLKELADLIEEIEAMR